MCGCDHHCGVPARPNVVLPLSSYSFLLHFSFADISFATQGKKKYIASVALTSGSHSLRPFSTFYAEHWFAT